MNCTIDVSKIRLETERLVLRPFSGDDLDDLYEYASIPGVGEMAGWPHHESAETSKRILQSFIEKKEVFALELKKNGKVVGSLGLHDSWANDDPQYIEMKSKEIGYVLSRDYWGQGLVPEAVKAVIVLCFHEYDCDILTCGHFSTNNQSRRVIEKCGFRFEKHSFFHAKQLNMAIEDMKYVLLRSDWQGAGCFIRSAQPADAAVLAEILCASWRSAYKDIITQEELERNTNIKSRTAMIERLQASGVSNIFLAFADGKPCGMISFGKSRDNDLADYAEIVAIYALESYWGKGVGGQLMRLALSEMKRLGYKNVLLWTFEANTRAQRFYEKNGFVADGATKESGLGNAKEMRYRLALGV